MARIQILELPEGSSDDRPPFVLVVDETAPQRIILGADTTWRDHWQDIAATIGARGVIVTPDTVDIPANDVPLDPDGYPIKFRVEGEFERFREQVQEEIAKAQAAVTRALRDAGRLRLAEESTGRPTHPDGTPYRYHEIKAEGWEHCDGCRTWGQWTHDSPHNCPGTHLKGPALRVGPGGWAQSSDTERSPEE